LHESEAQADLVLTRAFGRRAQAIRVLPMPARRRHQTISAPRGRPIQTVDPLDQRGDSLAGALRCTRTNLGSRERPGALEVSLSLSRACT
jgi:hypothetical protein